tara:strand:- start:78 stop:380 length:303 start_codon:yes stop_codon:yes gene_type:complete
MIPAEYLAGLGAILFCIGLVGVFTRANAIIVLMCVEIMLNAVNLNFVAGALHHGDVTGWVFTAIAIGIAAAEVAVGLAIFLSLYGEHESISLDDITTLKH